MDQEQESNVVSYYIPPKSLFKRFMLQLKKFAGLVFGPVRRNARWKRHDVYKFKPRKGYNTGRKVSGRSWRRHRIPPMPRSRSFYM